MEKLYCPECYARKFMGIELKEKASRETPYGHSVSTLPPCDTNGCIGRAVVKTNKGA